MKKILIVIFAALLLVGCAGTSDEELNSFIESFNENRRKTVERIEPANIGEVENDMQLLSEYKNIYKIYAKYEDNNLIGYKLEINPDGWYDEDTRGGYDTVETIASTLELDKMQFETEFSKAVIDGEYTYSDNGYEISFYYDISSDGELNEATIDFDKTSE